MKEKILILYMPVLHRGYLEFFEKIQPGSIALLSEEVLRDLPQGLEYITKKDSIRAVHSFQMAKVLSAITSAKIFWADEMMLSGFSFTGGEVLMPDEDVSRAVAERYFDKGKVAFIPGFKLRYHRNNVEEKKLLVPDRRVPISALDREIMEVAEGVAVRSPDWYRQVGGALAMEEKLIVGYNEHVPHEQIAATFGDPRSIFKSGVRTDLSLGDHCEHVLIGEAARLGISTDGSSLYITDFPCLPCSRLVVRAGVRKIFYRNPSYGLLDADQYLRIKKVELVEVSDEK
jgi:dCMP deaminase